jgi:hypothetical protein
MTSNVELVYDTPDEAYARDQEDLRWTSPGDHLLVGGWTGVTRQPDYSAPYVFLFASLFAGAFIILAIHMNPRSSMPDEGELSVSTTEIPLFIFADSPVPTSPQVAEVVEDKARTSDPLKDSGMPQAPKTPGPETKEGKKSSYVAKNPKDMTKAGKRGNGGQARLDGGKSSKGESPTSSTPPPLPAGSGGPKGPPRSTSTGGGGPRSGSGGSGSEAGTSTVPRADDLADAKGNYYEAKKVCEGRGYEISLDNATGKGTIKDKTGDTVWKGEIEGTQVAYWMYAAKMLKQSCAL